MKGMISIGDARFAMSKVVYYQLPENNKREFEIYLEGPNVIRLCYDKESDARRNFNEFDKQMREFFNEKGKTCKENTETLTKQPVKEEKKEIPPKFPQSSVNWRTDKPTEDVIVAQLSADFCGCKERYAILYMGTQAHLGVVCQGYFEDGEEVPYSAIVKWASLQEEPVNQQSSIVLNITEDYVSLEIAKLLKDKGFDEKCRTYYKVFPEDRIAVIYHSSENRGRSEDDPNEILCPTL